MHRRNQSGMLIAGLALGALAMYIWDPLLGRRRRALFRDKGVRLAHSTREGLRGAAIDLRNRASDRLAEIRARSTETDVSDDVLVERVRSELGRVSTHPRAIQVSAHEYNVTLEGKVLAAEEDAIVRAVRHVRGVRDITNQMECHEEAGSIPELQGRGRRS